MCCAGCRRRFFLRTYFEFQWLEDEQVDLPALQAPFSDLILHSLKTVADASASEAEQQTLQPEGTGELCTNTLYI